MVSNIFLKEVDFVFPSVNFDIIEGQWKVKWEKFTTNELHCIPDCQSFALLQDCSKWNMISHSQIFLLLLHNFYHSFLWKPLARFLLALLGHSSNIFISVISRPDRYTVQNLLLGIRGFAVPNEVNLTCAASNLGGCPVL